MRRRKPSVPFTSTATDGSSSRTFDDHKIRTIDGDGSREENRKNRRSLFSGAGADPMLVLVRVLLLVSVALHVAKYVKVKEPIFTNDITESIHPSLRTTDKSAVIIANGEGDGSKDDVIEQQISESYNYESGDDTSSSGDDIDKEEEITFPRDNEGIESEILDHGLVRRLEIERDIALGREHSVWVQTKDRDHYEQYAQEQIKDSAEFYQAELPIDSESPYYEFDDDIPQMDINKPYYAFDDDIVMMTVDESYQEGCRRTAINRFHRRNCNAFHEYDRPSTVLDQETLYLGSGEFRDAFLIFSSSVSDDNLTYAVFKSLTITKEDFDWVVLENLELSRNDATVQALLSASPRISNIYGYCALSLYTEFVPTEVESSVILPEYARGHYQPDLEEENPKSYNYLTVAEKLQLTLDFAKPIAETHYSSYGVIMHVDIRLDQFRRGFDGYLKLIDFNRAEMLLYNEQEEEYCTQEGVSGTIYRSPEEIAAAPIDESADVYNFGVNVAYEILTGLWRYSGMNEERVHEGLFKGYEIPYNRNYATKSYGEAILQRIVERCLQYDPDDRPTMAWTVDLLEKAIKRNKEIERNGVSEDEWKAYPEVSSLFLEF